MHLPTAGTQDHDVSPTLETHTVQQTSSLTQPDQSSEPSLPPQGTIYQDDVHQSEVPRLRLGPDGRGCALALASTITAKLHMTGTNFLSDCDQLVRFLNKDDLSNPPD